MSYRFKKLVRKLPKHEHESNINTKSLLSPKDITTTKPLLLNDDYQAPFMVHSLSPYSKWLIVRHNMHKIRSWGRLRRSSLIDRPLLDWYLFFQMRRELKRAEDQIRAIQYRPNFTPVRHFDLHIDETRVRRYNVSHVQSTDGIYYGGLGPEPIDLESLLYYFSKECAVPFNSMFYTFLSDVNSVLDTNRQRIQRVVVYRRLALITALVVSIFILIMFFSLILSVLTTTSNLRQMYKNDPDGSMIWRDTKTSVSRTFLDEE